MGAILLEFAGLAAGVPPVFNGILPPCGKSQGLDGGLLLGIEKCYRLRRRLLEADAVAELSNPREVLSAGREDPTFIPRIRPRLMTKQMWEGFANFPRQPVASFWWGNVHVLRKLANKYHDVETRPSLVGIETAWDYFEWHLHRMTPRLARILPNSGVGRWVLSRKDAAQKVRYTFSPGDYWEGIGLVPHPFIQVHVERFWGPVYASLAVPSRGEGLRCGERIPLPDNGRPSRREVCRSCQNATYYAKLKTSDGGKERLQRAWRESKQRGKGQPA